jgi:hypothetical protein
VGLDRHEIVKPPILLGVAEVELQLEAELIVVNDLMTGQGQVAAEEDNVKERLVLRSVWWSRHCRRARIVSIAIGFDRVGLELS